MTATAATASANILAGLIRRERSGLSSNVLTAAAIDGGGDIGREPGATEPIGFSPDEGIGGADPGIAARIGEELVGGGRGGGAEGRWLDGSGGGGGAADGRKPAGPRGIPGAGTLGIGGGGGGAAIGAPAAGSGALRAVSASSVMCLSKMAVFSSSSSQSTSIELVDGGVDGGVDAGPTGGRGEVIGTVGVRPSNGTTGGLPGTGTFEVENGAD